MTQLQTCESSQGTPIEQVLQGLLKARYGDAAPRIEFNGSPNFCVTDWNPPSDVWEAIDQVCYAVGLEARLDDDVLRVRPILESRVPVGWALP